MLALAAVLAPGAGLAQGAAAPRRPPLGDAADTNDPGAYRRYAEERLDRDPERAAAAYYWAARLNPASAEHVYGYRVALLMADRFRLRAYFTGDRRARGMRQIDSLEARAMLLNPFQHRWLDDQLVQKWVMDQVGSYVRNQGERVEEGEQWYVVNTWLRSHDSPYRPLVDYAQGRFRPALDAWAEVLRRHPRNAGLHAERAHIFYLSGQFDSARFELSTALTAARASEADTVRFFYQSTAVWEYCRGLILEQLGRHDDARLAFERTLTEDLSYYPAQVRLAALALARGDTAGTLRELARAVEAKDDEYGSRFAYGSVLRAVGRLDSAEVHLARAAELEPWTAEPRLLLGAVRDQLGDRPGALAALDEYLARARRADERAAQIRVFVNNARRASP
jgi:tetratricopeptide (TPR) repeat protein